MKTRNSIITPGFGSRQYGKGVEVPDSVVKSFPEDKRSKLFESSSSDEKKGKRKGKTKKEEEVVSPNEVESLPLELPEKE